MAEKKKTTSEHFLVCPECLYFNDDFPEGVEEGHSCPFCYDLTSETGPKLVVTDRRGFHVLIAKKIVREIFN